MATINFIDENGEIIESLNDTSLPLPRENEVIEFSWEENLYAVDYVKHSIRDRSLSETNIYIYEIEE